MDPLKTFYDWIIRDSCSLSIAIVRQSCDQNRFARVVDLNFTETQT